MRLLRLPQKKKTKNKKQKKKPLLHNELISTGTLVEKVSVKGPAVCCSQAPPSLQMTPKFHAYIAGNLSIHWDMWLVWLTCGWILVNPSTHVTCVEAMATRLVPLQHIKPLQRHRTSHRGHGSAEKVGGVRASAPSALKDATQVQVSTYGGENQLPQCWPSATMIRTKPEPHG
jgi:hypothetical protein